MITPKQAQIIRLLITNKEGFNVNQISRILNISLSWTHEALKYLESQGILNSERKGNSLVFTLNWKNPKTEKLCSLLIIDSEEASKIEKNLEGKKSVQRENTAAYKRVYAQPAARNSYTKQNTYSSQTSYTKQQTMGAVYSSVNPLGEQGVNSLLSAYAQSGAFGTASAYNSQSVVPPTVPPETLGARISRNVSGFNFASHSVEHRNNVITGCRYCDSI